MKTKLLAGAMALALIGCSEKPASESARPSEEATADYSADSSSSYNGSSRGGSSSSSSGSGAGARAPNISVTAAPGVAFNYNYAFRIDDDRIAAVQEEHAAACEALGINRCRITGMDYRLIRENEVEARLQFKLDPVIARKFGKDAIASVAKAEGVLAAAHITGDDVGTQISESQRRTANITDEIARLESRLKQAGLGDRERSEVQQQLANLRQQTEGERDTQRTGQALLATTPMTFDYQGTGGLPGIGYGNPFSDSANMLIRSGGTLLSFVLVVGAAVLPWALFFALLTFLWRTPPIRVLREWLRPKRPETDPAPMPVD